MADNLLAALQALTPATYGSKPKMIRLRDEHPELFPAIEQAWRRKVSARDIARTLTAGGHVVNETTVRNWCNEQYGKR